MAADCIELIVPQALYCYIMHTTGGETIRLGKNGILWAVIKQHLICYTRWKQELEALPPSQSSKTIKIELLRKNGAESPGMGISLNTSSRKFLSTQGQRIVSRLLISEFQKSFLDYMKGATMANPEINIKDAIRIYCCDCGMNFIDNYETLKKRWYRYRRSNKMHQNTLINL